MSVIIVAPDRYETIRKTVRHLRAQTVKHLLEIVIVAPSEEKLGLVGSEVEEFFQTRVVELNMVSSLAAARAVGIRQASTPVVVFAEDHSFPDPGWAEALIQAHKVPWAAVGSVICNANPESVASWAQLFLTYGRWTEPASAAEIDDLPGHNSSYKRALLLNYGSELETKLLRETMLHWDLRARGYRLYFEPAARTYHVNISQLFYIMQDSFYGGRLFAATRASNGRWSLLKRLVYAASEPFFLLRHSRGVLKNIRRAGLWEKLMPRAIPILVLGLAALGLGEMLGYAFGAGDSERLANSFEFHRHRFLTEQDRQLGIV